MKRQSLNDLVRSIVSAASAAAPVEAPVEAVTSPAPAAAPVEAVTSPAPAAAPVEAPVEAVTSPAPRSTIKLYEDERIRPALDKFRKANEEFQNKDDSIAAAIQLYKEVLNPYRICSLLEQDVSERVKNQGSCI